MTESIFRIAAIMRADFWIRFRRTSTAVMFLLLCITAYLWIPDPSTGKALIQLNEQRALYNSPALALATAALANILLGLIGYYLVSNSIGRDTRTRTGFVISSTTVKNFEYVLGIFFGNIIFLTAVIGGFMISSMIMQLVRGEAALAPSSFLWHYFILVPPMILFVSAVAVLFESSKWLSGRIGDLLYFFVWMFVLAAVATAAEKNGGKNWNSYIDTFGFAFLLDGVKAATHSDALSIGSTSFDASKPPFIFQGLSLSSYWLGPRLVSTFYPLLIVATALPFFHRFNPLKVKASQGRTKQSLLSIVNRVSAPLASPLGLLAGRFAQKPGLVSATFSEMSLTLQLYPITIPLLLASWAIAIFASAHSLQQKVLPAIFVALALILADLATREKRSGTTSMIESMPFLKRHFIMWKASTAVGLILLFTFIPAIRLAVDQPSSAISLMIGSLLMACAATGLGIASTNPKTFIVTFLMFLYIVLNDGGKNPVFDFAGWFGVATPLIQLTYLLIAAGMLAIASMLYRVERRL
jgi:hypothetical protein